MVSNSLQYCKQKLLVFAHLWQQRRCRSRSGVGNCGSTATENEPGRSMAPTRFPVATYLRLFLAQHVFPLQHLEPSQQLPAKAPTVIVSARTRAIRPEVIFFINNSPIRLLVSDERLAAQNLPRQKRNGRESKSAERGFVEEGRMRSGVGPPGADRSPQGGEAEAKWALPTAQHQSARYFQ